MSQEFPQVEQLEQDHGGDGSLPTYDDLRTQEGPNSRFGRWQQWIEKRAAERYRDDTYEAYQRRRNRGWGEQETPPPAAELEPSYQANTVQPPPPPPNLGDAPAYTPARNPSVISVARTFASTNSPTAPLAVGQSLEPCQLALQNFGSRFLPHSKTPITAALPLMGDRYLLIGHEEGLDVLDMMPEDSYEGNPRDARTRAVWRGESVCQIMQLEQAAPDATRIPQGVILMLVSPAGCDARGEGKEPPRILRMYNLASLVSLVKLVTAQADIQPVDLARSSSPMDQAAHKKHGRAHSLVKSLKHLSTEPTASRHSLQAQPATVHSREAGRAASSVPPKDSPPVGMRPDPLAAGRSDSVSSIDSASWDIIDDLPLRWATDFVPLASPGSHLFGLSVTTFVLSRPQDGLGRTLLAIATNSAIFLYDTPHGTRTFRYVKEYYTPFPSRTLAFVAQAPRDGLSRSSTSQHGPKHHDTADGLRPTSTISGSTTPTRPRASSTNTQTPMPAQLSLFVTFDKKAGLIRISDAAVSELELWDEPHPTIGLTAGGLGHGTFRRSLASLESIGFGRDGRGGWLPLSTVTIPPVRAASAHPLMETVYLLSRAKATHVVQSPLPIPLPARPPLRVLRWKMQPNHVHGRVLQPRSGRLATLQLIAFGDDGVEVQEMTVESLFNRPVVTGSPGKGKGRAEDTDIVRADADVGGPCGFLAVGGNWEDSMGFAHNLYRSDSVRSIDSEDLVVQRREAQGVYGWCGKGWENNDFRAFWLGAPIEHGE